LKEIRAVLFDAGGTLIHIDGERVSRAAGVPFHAPLFRRADAAAVDAVRKFVLANPASKDAERLPLYLDTMLVSLGCTAPEERRAAAGRVAAEHARANLWSRGADGAPETLAVLLRRGYRVAVISNADGRVRGLLEKAGFGELLEFVVDSAEIGVEKPDPRIFHAATGRLGLSPAVCAYVGDIYEIDVLGAAAAGLVPVLIGDAPAPEGVLRVPNVRALDPLFPGFD
jgi:putative hydrolase of the HAD superfamily